MQLDPTYVSAFETPLHEAALPPQHLPGPRLTTHYTTHGILHYLHSYPDPNVKHLAKICKGAMKYCITQALMVIQEHFQALQSNVAPFSNWYSVCVMPHPSPLSFKAVRPLAALKGSALWKPLALQSCTNKTCPICNTGLAMIHGTQQAPTKNIHLDTSCRTLCPNGRMP